MKKIILDPAEIIEWKEGHWNLYASQSIPHGRNSMTKLLRLHINSNGWFKVTFGIDVLYEGTQMTHVIAAWDSV